METSSSVSVASITKHAGGRPKGTKNKRTFTERWMAARGISPLTASEVLAALGGELRYFKRALESEDDRVMLQALVFLVSMRDGKPAQQINVRSTSVVLNASDLEKARAIIAEIRRDANGIQDAPQTASPLQGNVQRVLEGDTGGIQRVYNSSQSETMLLEDEGGKGVVSVGDGEGAPESK